MTASSINAEAWIAFAELAGPIMIAMLVIGVIVGMLQTATQIREASVPFVLKLTGAAIIITLDGAAMLHSIDNYATDIFKAIPRIIHG